MATVTIKVEGTGAPGESETAPVPPAPRRSNAATDDDDGLPEEWFPRAPKVPTPIYPGNEKMFRPIPRANPVGPPGGQDTGTTFERPMPVVIVAPLPVPVAIVSGLPSGFGQGGGLPREPREPRERTFAERARDGFQMVGEMAGSAGRGTAALAANSGVGALSGAIGTASAGLSRLGPYGMAAAAAFQAAEKTVGALREAINSVVARAREIGNYDGRIAAANAMADVRKMQTDMREAQRLGDRYARVVDQQSKAEAILAELLNFFKGPLMTMLANGIEVSTRTLVGILQGIDQATAHLVPGLGELAANMKKILEGDPGIDMERLIKEALAAPIGVSFPTASTGVPAGRISGPLSPP